jgi:hypothetical protein
MRVVGQRPVASTQTIASTGGGCHEPNPNLDLLTYGYAAVFVELNRLAMNDDVNRSSRLWPPSAGCVSSVAGRNALIGQDPTTWNQVD